MDKNEFEKRTKRFFNETLRGADYLGNLCTNNKNVVKEKATILASILHVLALRIIIYPMGIFCLRGGSKEEYLEKFIQDAMESFEKLKNV